MSNSNLIELHPYIIGTSFLTGESQPARLSKDILQEFADFIASNSVAAELLQMTEHPDNFFRAMPDATTVVSKAYRSEVFYAAKLGNTFYENIPPSICYYVKKAVEQSNGIYNLVPKILPEKILKSSFTADVLIGANLADVVNIYCGGAYEPFSDFKRRIAHSDYDEVYVESTDMPAAIPKMLSNMLSDAQVRNIEVSPTGLKVGQQLLRTFGEYIGVCPSVYDLRELV